MKKWIIIVALCVLSVSCKWSGDFTIKGQIDGFAILDSVAVETDNGILAKAAINDNGSFKLKGNVSEPTLAFLTVDGGIPIMVVLIDGGSIKINGNLEDDNFTQSGTASGDAFAQYQKAYEELSTRFKASQTEQERTEIEKSFEALSRDAIGGNNNLFGLVVLASDHPMFIGKEMLEMLNKFSVELQNTAIGKQIRKIAEEKMKINVGSSYIDIVLPDRNGKEFKLSDYVGKGYVLLDFWASWCGFCLQELPYLKDSYEKYHERGFEIFGVSIDQNKDAWMKAVDNNNMTWLNTCTAMNPKATVANDYNISSVPSNFLIDKEGIIIAKNLRGEELFEKLKELLGE